MTGRLESLLFKVNLLDVDLPIFFDIFNALYLMMSIIFFFLSLMFLWFTTRQRIITKKSDIALMTAIGHCWRIGYFLFWENMTSTLIALFSGITGAILLAIIVQTLLLSVVFPFWLTIAYTMTFLLVSYFSISFIIRSFLVKSFKEIRDVGLSGELMVEGTILDDNNYSLIRRIIETIMIIFLRNHGRMIRKLSLKLFIRSLNNSKNYLVLSILLMTTITLSISGGIVIRDTTLDNLDGYIGENLYLVTFDQTASFILPLYEFTGTIIMSHTLDLQLVDAGTFKDRIKNISRVIDDRIFVYTEVREVSGRAIGDGQESTIGLARRTETVVLGINPSSLSQTWTYKGSNPINLSRGQVIIGDWLAINLFTDPFREKLRIFASTTNKDQYLQGPVITTIIDPLASGKAVYTRVEDLANLLNVNEGVRNVFLVELVNKDYKDALSRVADSFGMVAFPLTEKLASSMTWIDRLWSLHSLILLPIIVILVLSLIILLDNLFEGRRQVIGVLKALGARENVLNDIIMLEINLFLIISLLIGYTAGTLISGRMLIDEAVVSFGAVLPPLLLLFLAILFSMYMMKRVLRKKIRVSI
jgi:hypothetical protein